MFLKCCFVSLLAVVMTHSGRAAPDERGAAARPNVIVVITDDQGYGDLGCHGNKIIRTPNLDRLYAQSTRLTNFHVSPTCAPTRAALMTGRYANATGVWHTIMGRSILRRDEATIGRVFADAGYATAMFGKWHLGDNFPSRPEDMGFQHVVRHGGGGVGQVPDEWGNDYFDDTYLVDGKRKKFVGYCTDIWFSEALKFIDAQAKQEEGRPFLAYLSTNAPHAPYFVADRYRKMYAGNAEILEPAFYGMITNIDENIGRLLEKLDALGLSENTMVIFMTDNGTAAGYADPGKGLGAEKGFNAGMRGTKGSEYDGGHRVPFFIRWPGGGVIEGRDIPTLTAHIDVLPTLMDYCSIKARPEGAPLMHGRSLVPLISGDAQSWGARTLVTDSQRIEIPEKWRHSAVMTDRWRLINGAELYDIGADPGQRQDIAAANPKVVASLRDEYELWWKSVSTRFGETCDIVVGDERESPSRLTSHDWHGEDVPWNQDMVKAGSAGSGSWAIDVAEAGRYRVTLTRWPLELAVPINGTVVGGKAIAITKARLLAGAGEQEKPVEPGAVEVNFEVDLGVGTQRLQAWLVDESAGDPIERGAYFVYLKRL